MRRPVLAACLLLALGSVASSQSGAPDDGPSPMEILSPAAPPPPAAAKAPGVLAKADPKADAAKADAANKPESNAEYLAQCLRDWDAATHMTRREWSRTCRRVASSRPRFPSDQDTTDQGK
jgi:hypothetical protein